MAPSIIRAAQYVRMSTEHQKYSIEFQSAINATYAAAKDIEIVRTYEDAGISGLTFEKRAGLRQLLADILDGSAGIDLVLVYDVSRWGRFQDPDESAHYEFLCRSAGVQVRYTAEPFDNDGSLASSLVKQLKRAMAAEFSRELSTRVSKTQRGLAAKGFWMGGPTAYGLSRQIIGANGENRGVLKSGERAAIRGERIILVPGEAHERRLVRQIFRWFADDDVPIREIVHRLNAKGLTATCGARWTTPRVRGMLHNEVYLGTNVIGKFHHRLGRRERQPKSNWQRAVRAFAPIISQRLFQAAQQRFRTNMGSVSDERLLEELGSALLRHGSLSRRIIDRDPYTHCASVYQARFGSLSAVYARVQYTMSNQQAATSAAAFRDRPHRHRGPRPKVSDDVILSTLAEVLSQNGRLTTDLINETPGLPRIGSLRSRFGSLLNLYEQLGYEPDARQRGPMRRGASVLGAIHPPTSTNLAR